MNIYIISYPKRSPKGK